jgi:hypothetical protein
MFTKTKKSKLAILTISTLLIAYLVAFVIVHRSGTLRHPAANMLYYYYSDNAVMENIEFYGFWPLRHIGYHIPGFEMRHNADRMIPDFRNAEM